MFVPSPGWEVSTDAETQPQGQKKKKNIPLTNIWNLIETAFPVSHKKWSSVEGNE